MKTMIATRMRAVMVYLGRFTIPGIKGRGVRIRSEWSPEQLATTTPRTTQPAKGFPPGRRSIVRSGIRHLDDSAAQCAGLRRRRTAEESLGNSECSTLSISDRSDGTPGDSIVRRCATRWGLRDFIRVPQALMPSCIPG